MNRRSLAALVGGCALAGACYNLDVVAIQPTAGTSYTREEILGSPVLMERVVAGTFVNLWAAVVDASPWLYFGIYGEEITSSATDISGPNFAYVREPRGEVLNNLGVDHDIMKTPWSFFYEANAAAAEFSGIAERENIRIIDPATDLDNTERFHAFAKFVMGLSHVHLGLIFDSAAIVHSGLDLSRPTPLPLAGYQEVLDSAVSFLEQAITIAQSRTFAFPINEGQWIYNSSFDNQRLQAVAHAYIARALAYGPRTPEARQTNCPDQDVVVNCVPWDRVKQHLALATKVNFGARGSPVNTPLTWAYRSAATAAPLDPNNPDPICNGECRFPGLARVDNRLVGPADTSGNYQQWLAGAATDRFDTTSPFFIETADQRIQEVGGTTPLAKPAYFKWTDLWPPQSAMDTALRGKYYVSFYWNSTRASNNHTQFPRDGGGRNETDADLDNINDEMLLAVEMDLLLAEANIRASTPDIPAAIELINKSRINNGELPAVTAAGVPQGTGCVPKRWDGTCGTLFDALVYEKRLETYATGIAFFDARGWGCLLEGTPMHLPPPGSQLDIMGKVIYSYGGTTGPTAGAPKPTNCPLMHRP
jgi:hypothetical protein